MSGFLIDTNILSELRKGSRAHSKVRKWAQDITNHSQYISVLSLGEIRKGIDSLNRKDPVEAQILEEWLQQLQAGYDDCILPVCSRVADRWGTIQAGRSFPVIDSYLAATAQLHRLTLATRNVKDFTDLDVPVMNPFD